MIGFSFSPSVGNIDHVVMYLARERRLEDLQNILLNGNEMSISVQINVSFWVQQGFSVHDDLPIFYSLWSFI